MNVYTFDDEFSHESVTSLIYRIEDSRDKSLFKEIEGSDEIDVLRNRIVLYFSTNGGVVSSAHVLSSYFKELILNEHLIVDIVVTEWCHSAGLFFLMDLYNFRKTLEHKDYLGFQFFEHAEACLHEVATQINTRIPDSDLSKRIERIKTRKPRIAKFFKPHLTAKEMSDFNKAQDVILSCDRLAKIFDAKVIKTF